MKTYERMVYWTNGRDEVSLLDCGEGSGRETWTDDECEAKAQRVADEMGLAWGGGWLTIGPFRE